MMKYLLLIFLLVLPTVYAQDLILAKEIYSPKETFQAEIFIKDVKPYDVTILNPIGYRSNVGINLLKISREHYFVFFDVPQLDLGNYTLKVKEAKIQFEIKPKTEKIISVSTGAIKFTPEDSPFFKITVSNHDIKSETIEITSSSTSLIPSLNTLILPGKSSKTFNIRLDKPSSSLLDVLSIGDYYKIPVWFIVEEKIISFFEKEIKEEPEKIETGLKFYTKSGTQLNYITKEIQKSVPIVDSIYFKNLLNESLTNLRISLTGNLQGIIKLEFTELKTLVPNEEKKLGIIVNEERSLLENSYSGDLLITTDKHIFKLPIDFIVVETAEEPWSLTLEGSIEHLEEEPKVIEPVINKTKVEEKPKVIQYKWVYLIALIIILMIFAYLSLKKPKPKKQTFKEYIKKAGY